MPSNTRPDPDNNSLNPNAKKEGADARMRGEGCTNLTREERNELEEEGFLDPAQKSGSSN